jgi:soluble lytic murein transglycosylase-like protein
MFKAGRADDIYNFYDGFIKNKEATICIINTALIFDIPVHYFIALAYQESNFNWRRPAKRNRDGSHDIGMFQLNTKVYKKYDVSYLIEIKNNVRMAGAHLADNYLTAGNYYTALGIYNAGNEKNINFNHVKNILLYSDSLDEKFAEKF